MLAIGISFAVSLVFLAIMSALTLSRKRKSKWSSAIASIWADRLVGAVMCAGSIAFMLAITVGSVSGWWIVPLAAIAMILIALGSLIISVSIGEMQELKETIRYESLPEPLNEEDLERGIDWDEVEEFLRQSNKS